MNGPKLNFRDRLPKNSRYPALTAVFIIALVSPRVNAQSILWDTYISDADAAYKDNRFGEAEKLYKLALVEAEKFDSNDPRLATNLNNLGLVYVYSKKYDQAESLIRRALAIREKSLGSEHADTATSVSNLGRLYFSQNKLDQAEPFYRRALIIRKKIVINDPLDQNTTLSRLIDLATEKFDFERVQLLIKRGGNHSNVAATLNDLADIATRRREFGEAERLNKEALAIQQRVNTDGGADSLERLVFLYQIQKRNEQIEPLLDRVLAQWEKLGAKDYVAVRYGSQGLEYESQRNYDFAEASYKLELLICEKVFGVNHVDVADSLCSLASLYQKQAHHEQAESLYKRALAIKERALGYDDNAVAIIRSSLVVLYASQKRYDLIEAIYLRELGIKEKTLGLEHQDIVSSLGFLGWAYCEQGKYDQAESVYRRALTIREKALGADHPDVAHSLDGLAQVYAKQRKFDRAEPLSKRSLAIREKTLGPGHLDVAISLVNLAGLNKDQEKYDQAEVLYKRAMAIREKALDADNSAGAIGPIESMRAAMLANNLAIAFENYADLLKKTNRQSESDKLIERAKAIRARSK